MDDVTRILAQVEAGEGQATEELLRLVYDELRKLAAARLVREAPGQTLSATALVHEAYLRLVGPGTQTWQSRGHFFGAAAEAMRRLLIEQARRKQRLRHGGGRQRVDLDSGLLVAGNERDELNGLDLIALDEALERFAAEEPEGASVVKLRYFSGLTIEQTATVMGISERTVNRHWTYARAWLYRQLSDSAG
jgi:RNA polymerase sigma factor (TIGR02999 family)